MSAGSKRIIGQQAGIEKTGMEKSAPEGLINHVPIRSVSDWQIVSARLQTCSSGGAGGAQRQQNTVALHFLAGAPHGCPTLPRGWRTPGWPTCCHDLDQVLWLTVKTEPERRMRPNLILERSSLFFSFEASGRGPAFTKGCFFRKLHNLALYQICDVVLIPLCGCKTETCR